MTVWVCERRVYGDYYGPSCEVAIVGSSLEKVVEWIKRNGRPGEENFAVWSMPIDEAVLPENFAIFDGAGCRLEEKDWPE